MLIEQSNSAAKLILTSHSIDNTFDYCPRKFEFLNLYDKRPPRDSGYAANIGTALHEGLQAWFIAKAEGKSESERTKAAFMALCLWFPWEQELEQKTSVRSFNNTALVLYELIRSPEWDDWDLVKVADKGWAIEIPFLIKHASLGEFRIKATGELAMLATQGKIDFILRHRRTNEIRCWDLKTTILGQDLARAEYTYSGQQIGYSHVLHAMLGVSPANFSVWYMIARFSASEIPQIQAVEYMKGEDMVDDYWLTKLDRLARMKSYAENDWFPRTNGGCHAWGNECAFFDICRTRETSLITRWFDTIDSVPQQGYDWWVEMEV